MAYLSIGVPIVSPVASPRKFAHDNDYFYTLVFPNTKCAEDDGEAGNTGANDNRLRYSDAVSILRTVTGGDKEREARVVAEFRDAWVAKFRTPPPASHDTISPLHFHELVRELIVQRFDAIPNLFLRTTLSNDQQSLLISFRPAEALLCETADKLRMRVAIMAEIDPGESYWSTDPTRVANESNQWDRANAKEELYRMFLAGKISTDEAQIFDTAGDHEDAAMWSRRIHALRRFVDPELTKVVAEQDIQKSPGTYAYLPFKNRASLRYLYQQIDGDGSNTTPFRVVDKIRLTKAIIDAEFDCDELVEKRLLTHHLCMHSHHTDAIDTSIDVLHAQWGSFTSPLRLYFQGLVRAAEILHIQPIAHIRNYFGEEIALYCAYTSFYAQALQWQCGAAVAASLLHRLHLFDGVASYWYYVAFAIVNTVFTQVLVRKWEVQERRHASQWGVTSFQHAEIPRPQYQGEPAISGIAHRLEAFYSPQLRQLQQCGSAIVLVATSLGMLGADWLVLTSKLYKQAVHSNPVLVNIAVAVFSKLLRGPIAALCQALSEWENHRTQQDFDLNLTLKFAVVQTVNVFGFLWLQTFVVPFVSALSNSSGAEYEHPAAHLLLTFLVVDLVASAWDLRVCFCSYIIDSYISPTLHWLGISSVKNSDDRSRLLVTAPFGSSHLAKELAFDSYDGVMFDYAQVIINFGFVAWFAALEPLSTLLAWAIAVLQIRADAFKFCDRMQRPFPRQNNSIGSWGSYLHLIGFGSWVHNALLTILHISSASPTGLQDLKELFLVNDVVVSESAETKRLIAETLLLVVFATFCCVALFASVQDQHDRAELKRLGWLKARQQFLENKYINNLDRVSDSVRESLPSGRVFLNGVHLYVVTGNKVEEDAADEILDDLLELQLRSLHLQRQITELRMVGAAVGTLVVEIGSINILPVMDALTKAVDSYLQLQLAHGETVVDGMAKQKKDKPVNTSVIKKNRSPSWTETFELTLRSLDDALLIRVYDWELMGKNRRIGHATLRVADVVAVAPPLRGRAPLGGGEAVPVADARQSALSVLTQTCTAVAVSPSSSPRAFSSPPQSHKVRLATFETAIEMPDVLLSTMHPELVKHGHPKVSLRCGAQLDALGQLLLQHRNLQSKICQLKNREKQFYQWN